MTLPQGNQYPTLINETDCTITIDGREHSGQGAYVTPEIAIVYVTTNYAGVATHTPEVAITDWHGNLIGIGRITGQWTQTNPRQRYRMASIQFKIAENNTWYRGRLSLDGGNLLKGRRMREQRDYKHAYR